MKRALAKRKKNSVGSVNRLSLDGDCGKTSPQLDTVLANSLGKTLAVVPLEQEKV